MSQSSNVIITSGSKNQIIHVPVVNTSLRSGTPFELLTTSKGLTINSTNNLIINSNKLNRNSSVLTNKEIFSTNEDNSEVKTIYVNKDSHELREQLLLPTEYIKEELNEEEYEEYEEYESLNEEEDGEGADDLANAKTQYKCSACGKGFCYSGWVDRHKLTSPACRDAHPIKQTIDNTSADGLSMRQRSLEGRLDQLLSCPNKNCNFVTHWVQSLNKHVFNSCKFGDESEDNAKALQVCHLCNKGFNDSEQHIQHMKNCHQIKLFYQCSECKLNFDTKLESEAHIQTHNRLGKFTAKEKVVSAPIASPKPAVTNGLNTSAQQYWLCDLCNKSYLSMRSYEIHRSSCEKSIHRSVRTSTDSLPTEPTGYTSPSAVRSSQPKDNTAVKHLKREQLKAIHPPNNFRCKYCKKFFDNTFGLSNHLSRRPECREWYYTYIGDLNQKNGTNTLFKDNRKQNNFTVPSSPIRRGPNNLSLNSLSKMTAGKRSRKSALASQRSINFHSGTNSARCDKCRKVFVGKNPTVALTNHLRGSTCVPTKYNPLQKPQIVRSRTLTANQTNNTPKSANESRFYCKLCPRIELKNRVSLGCHLTIYHGLPQVNVTTADGDGFRCQNCSQVFTSKYFYNLHRQDCDLTSDYIGIVNDGDHVSQTMKSNNNSRNRSQSSALNRNVNTVSDGSGMKCQLCLKTGFSNENQLNIHLKYQCIKRRGQYTKPQPNVKRVITNSTPIVKTSKPVPQEDKPMVPTIESVRVYDKPKSFPNQSFCESCGKGPYNSLYYFMEHKKKYCNALKSTDLGSVAINNRAKKSFLIEERSAQLMNESICLNPIIPRARKTMNYANVTSPQISHDSSPQIQNESESEEVVVSVSEVTKCTACEEEFDDILQFIRHRLSHITEDIMQSDSNDSFDCELCGAVVHHFQRIQQHLILHLQNVQILKKKNLIEISKKSLNFRQFSDESDEDMDATDGSPVLQCPYCKSEYRSRLELAEHIKKTCPYKYKCSNCNNTYSNKESYSEHRDVCTKSTAIDKITSKAPTYKCRNCGLEFRIKQQLLWHEHACNKVYTSDYSGRVEEVIERTLSCSVCGLVSDVYEHKVRHESQCLKRYLAVIGNSTEEIKTSGEVLSQPLNPMDFDLTSLSNTSQSSEVPEELINNLKNEFGIQREVKVVLTAFDEEMIRNLKTELYCEREESVQYEALKESFMALVRRLIKNDEVLHEMGQESSAEVLLSRMLKYLGEESVEHNGLNQLSCFRQNLQTFLKLTIKDDTLILAYRDAESVDEAVINMLNFECELHC